MTRILLSSVAAAAVLASAPAAWAQTEIQWWHAMGGNLGEAVNALADGLQQVARANTRSNPVYKGSYTETLTAAIAAFRAKQAPHIVQVFEVGTANMMAAKGAVYPVLPADGRRQGAVRSQGLYRPGLRLLLDDRRQAAVDAVQLLDAGALLEQGAASRRPASTPTSRRQTWPELGEMAKKAVAAGAKCGFTPQWQTWTMIENYGAWHNLPYATKDNGFGGTDIELKFNDAPRVKLHPDAGRLGQGQDVRLWRPRGQVDGAVHRRRLRLPHRLVGHGRRHRQGAGHRTSSASP